MESVHERLIPESGESPRYSCAYFLKSVLNFRQPAGGATPPNADEFSVHVPRAHNFRRLGVADLRPGATASAQRP